MSNKKIIKIFPKKFSLDVDDLIKILIKDKKKVGVFTIGSSAWNDLGVWPEYQKTVKKFV